MYILHALHDLSRCSGQQLLKGGKRPLEFALLHQLYGGLILLKDRPRCRGRVAAWLGSRRGSFFAACCRGIVPLASWIHCVTFVLKRKLAPDEFR